MHETPPSPAELQPASDSPWPRRAPWLVAFAAVVSLFWTVHGWYDPANDASIYLACTRSLLEGDGYAYLGEPFRVRPPGMSLLIAPILMSRGFDAYALNLLTSLSGVLAVALGCAWARARVGAPFAIACAALVWLNPTFQKLANQTLSDVPGVACLFACLLAERWAARKPSTARDVVLGLAIAASAYLRTLLVLLVPALLVARWFTRDRNASAWSFLRSRALVVPLTVVLALLPWSVRNSLADTGAPAEQTMLASYWTGLWHVDEGDPSSPLRPFGSLVDRSLQRTEEVGAILGTNLKTSVGSFDTWVIGGVLVGLALISVWRRRETADVFFVLTLGVLVTYFAFEDRLALPVWALVWPLAVDGGLVFGGLVFGERRIRTVLFLGSSLLAFRCADLRRGWDEIAERDAAWRKAAASFSAALPPDATLASVGGWHYQAFLDRPVWNLGFAMRRARSFAGAESVLEKHSVDVVLQADVDATILGVEPELASRYRLEEVPGGRIWHVRER